VHAQYALYVQGALLLGLSPNVGGGRGLTSEITVVTPAIRNLNREDKIHQIYSAIGTVVKYGMQTMNQSLADLVRRNQITRDEALNQSMMVEELLQLLEGGAPSTAASAAPGAPAHGGSPFSKR